MVKKALLSFKSKPEQLISEANDILDFIGVRFPFNNYITCPIYKEDPATNTIG